MAQRFFTFRYSLALVFAFAIVALVVNETTYRETTNLLRSGVALTDARVASHRLMIAINEAESAQRGYLVTGQQKHLEVYKQALARIDQPKDQIETYFSSLDNAPLDTVVLSDLVGRKIEELNQGLQRQVSGIPGPLLLEAEPGRPDLMAAIREKLERTLEHAASATIDIRADLFRSIALTRAAIFALILLALGGIWLLFRQFQREQAEKIIQREALRARVDARTAELRSLARDMQTVREDERRHLARELHDELGGLLTTVKLDLARIKAHGASDAWLQERLAKLNVRLNEGIAIKRRMIETLRPSSLDNLGLIAALTILCRESGDSMGLQIHHDLEEIDLGADMNLCIYRFVQEALTNAAKHAKATRIDVSLKREDPWVLARVSDDGLGFDETVAKTGHHGLTGMRFRLESHEGSLTIHSQPSQGSVLEARLPLALAETQTNAR